MIKDLWYRFYSYLRGHPAVPIKLGPNLYKSSYPKKDGLFSSNLIHFLYCTHMVPAIHLVINKYKENGAASIETSQGEVITTYLQELPEITTEDFGKLGREINQLSAQILLSDCFEKIKKLNIDDKSEIIEFLRHVRNACSHQGKFEIRENPLRFKAKWRNLEITPILNGKDLFTFLAIGDSLLLIQDIESYLLNDKSKWRTGD